MTEIYEWDGYLLNAYPKKKVFANFKVVSHGMKGQFSRHAPWDGEMPELVLQEIRDEDDQAVTLDAKEKSELEEHVSEIYYEELYERNEE